LPSTAMSPPWKVHARPGTGAGSRVIRMCRAVLGSDSNRMQHNTKVLRG